MAERAGSHRSVRRLPITTVVAAILAIVAAFSLVQRMRAVSHRYDDVDFYFYYGWWTDYSSGGDPFVVKSKPIELRSGLSRPRYCNNTPFLVEIFSPLARFDQKTAFWIWQAAQILCLVVAVLMLASGNNSPWRSADRHRAFTAAAVAPVRGHAGAGVHSDAADAVVRVMVLRAPRTSGGSGSMPGAGGVGEALSGDGRRILFVRPPLAGARLSDRMLRHRRVVQIPPTGSSSRRGQISFRLTTWSAPNLPCSRSCEEALRNSPAPRSPRRRSS